MDDSIRLSQLLPVPDPMRSEAELNRFTHADVQSLTRADLQRELTVLRLINFVGGTEWHLEREQLLAERLAP